MSGSTNSKHPLIEVGWVLVGPLEPVDLEAAQKTRRLVHKWLSEHFGSFTWEMPVSRRREVATHESADPVRLLDEGVTERDAKGWDFVLVVTATDLETYYKPFAFATPAQSLGVAVCSTARLDPAATLGSTSHSERVDTIARRLKALALHQIGHLNDLSHQEAPTDLMYDLKTVEDLDGMISFSDDVKLRDELGEVADVRLEEREMRIHQWWFALRAAWINRDDIWSAVRHIQPWRFPFRFSRLTTAALSTLLVLMTTAEAWDLAISESPMLVTLLSLGVWSGTSYFLLRQQQLLVRRRKHRSSEQRVVARFSIVLSVLAGMAATYVLLFGLTIMLAYTFFSLALIEDWVTTVEGPLLFGHYVRLAGFIAAFGLVIGSLGASFEKQTYFRHVAFVTEET